MSRRYFTADDGVQLPVHVHGEGPALVVLHGWTGHPQDWRQVIDRLKNRFTLYVWEARPYHAGDPTIERMGRDLANLFDAFALERPFLMGHSMGALISWEYLRQFGDARLAALCLVDQSPKLMTDADWTQGLWGGYGPADNERFRQALERDFADGVIDLISNSRRTPSGAPGIPRDILETRRQRLARMVPEPWIAAWQSFVVKDFRPVLPTLRVPTLLVYGAKSAYYGPRVAEYVHRHIQGSELRLYPDAGHGPHVENLDEFVADVLGFAERQRLI